MISAVWDPLLDQYQAELIIYKAKEDKITDIQAKMKNSLCHLFCTQNEKILTFWVDLWSQKVMWLRNGRSDFRKLGVKISARLQRKGMKQRGWKRGGFACAAKFVPPVQLGFNKNQVMD